jgi:hypothetical protein
MYALINNNVVVNVIVADADFIALIQNQYQYCVSITNNPGDPGIGWTYDGTSFSPLSPPSLPLNQQYTPAQYGQMLINEFTAGNAQRGMTSSQLLTLASNLGPYYILLQCGSLQAFLDESPNIPIDGVLITTAIISSFQAACTAYLQGE